MSQKQNNVKKFSGRIIFWITAFLPIIAVIILFSGFFPAAYGLSNGPPARTMISPIYFTTCITAVFGYCVGILISKKIGKWNIQSRFINLFLYCIIPVFVLNGMRDTKRILANEEQLKTFSIAFDTREELIIDAKNKGESIVYVPKLNHFMPSGITNDSTDWVNECVSGYYGITVIVDNTLAANDIFHWRK